MFRTRDPSRTLGPELNIKIKSTPAGVLLDRQWIISVIYLYRHRPPHHPYPTYP